MKSIKILILFLIAFTFPAQLNSQELQRKAMLGIRMMDLNDSIAKANHIKINSGIFILSVVPKSTVANIGLEPGAVIIKINDQKIESTRDIAHTVPNLREGDPIKITFVQNGKTIAKSTKAKGRVKETVTNGHVFYEQINFNDHRLRTILMVPEGIEQPPVVYFIQGYTCASTEFSMIQDIAIKKLMDEWVKAGYAVFRVEKAGIGDSDGPKHCMEMGFNEELAIFKQGYKTLQTHKKIDPEQIFIFGHSMGGVVAPILAKEFQPKGVMTYGTLVHSWFEYMQELTRVQGEMFHTPYAEVENDIRTITPFWYEYFVLGKTNTELLENPKHEKMLTDEGTIEAFKAGVFMDRHYTFWQELQQVSLVNTWLDVKSNVLALYGEFDIQALNPNHIKTIAAIVNTNNPGKAQWKIIKKADHAFVQFDSMDENVNTLNSGAYFQAMMKRYHPGIAKTTIEWMKQL